MRIKPCKNGIRFSVLIQPRASKNEVTGIQNDALKIRISAPPVEDLANKLCIRFFAKCLDVSPSEVNIIQGLNSKNKIIEVMSLTEEQFLQILKNRNLVPKKIP